jgi:hypothetical protein
VPDEKKNRRISDNCHRLLPNRCPVSVVEAGVGMPAPEISAQSWLNSEPVRIAELKGKVVLVKFWTLVVTTAAMSNLH